MKKIINKVVVFIEVSMVAFLFILENLSWQKAGVNHHVIARKIQWSEKYFTVKNIEILTFAIIAIILTAIFIQAVNIRKNHTVKQRKELGIHNGTAILSAGIFLLSLKNEVFLNLNISAYITFASMLVFLFEILIIILLLVREK